MVEHLGDIEKTIVMLNNCMNYHRIYNQLMNRAIGRECHGSFIEKHHIIPRCMNGGNDAINIVKLTHEEHFLAHLLLVKMFPENHKLVYAANMMTMGHAGKRHNRKLYGQFRRKFIEISKINQIGSKNSRYGFCWINNGKISKTIMKNDTIPLGWKYGRVKKELPNCKLCNSKASTVFSKYCKIHHAIIKSELGRKNVKKIVGAGPAGYINKRFITNGIVDKLLHQNLPIPDNWWLGRTQNRHKILRN